MHIPPFKTTLILNYIKCNPCALSGNTLLKKKKTFSLEKNHLLFLQMLSCECQHVRRKKFLVLITFSLSIKCFYINYSRAIQKTFRNPFLVFLRNVIDNFGNLLISLDFFQCSIKKQFGCLPPTFFDKFFICSNFLKEFNSKSLFKKVIFLTFIVQSELSRPAQQY
jgi:hypothetical protein